MRSDLFSNNSYRTLAIFNQKESEHRILCFSETYSTPLYFPQLLFYKLIFSIISLTPSGSVSLGVKMVNNHMKRCSIALIIRDNKTTNKYHFTADIMTTIIKSINSKCWKDVGKKKELSYTVDGNVNLYSYYRKQYGYSFKT